MKISFATTCMGRLHHLQQTLPQNIKDNPSRPGLDVEFVVLNYNSRDGMHKWMTRDPFCVEQAERGVIKYAHFRDSEFFRMAHAKNMAHRLATGDVICNLDADNFAGEGFADFLGRVFSRDINSLVNPDFKYGETFSPEDRGFYGRIAISRDNFYHLGGYNEKFASWGGDDSNFRRRAKGYGLHHVHFTEPSFLRLLSHSSEDRVCNMEDPDKVLKSMNARIERNRNITLGEKLKEAFATAVTPVQANNSSDFGQGQVYLGGEAVPEMLGAVRETKIPAGWVAAFGAVEMFKGRFAPNIVSPARPEAFT